MLQRLKTVSDCWLKKAFFILFAISFIFVPIQRADAHVVLLTDVENTLFNSRSGAWNTPIILTRMDYPVVPLQPVPSGPKQIYVPIHVYDQIKFMIAQSVDNPGRIHLEGIELPKGKTPDGKEVSFYPGEYYLNQATAFQFFRANPGGENYYLRSIKEAVQNFPNGEWLGPAFQIVKTFLSNPNLADLVGWNTVRSHSKAEIEEGNRVLTKLPKDNPAYLPRGFNPDMLFGTTDPNLSYLSGNGLNGVAQKTALIRQVLQRSADTPLTQDDLRIHPDDPKLAKIKTHLFIYPEDDPNILREVIATLEDAARARVGSRVKTVLINLASDKDITEFRLPSERFITFKTDGTIRAATPEEVFGENPNVTKKEMKRILADVASYFQKLKVAEAQPNGKSCGGPMKGGQ